MGCRAASMGMEIVVQGIGYSEGLFGGGGGNFEWSGGADAGWLGDLDLGDLGGE